MLIALTDGGDGGDDLAKLELVEDGGLSGGVEPHHKDPHLLLTCNRKTPNPAHQNADPPHAHQKEHHYPLRTNFHHSMFT